MEFCVYVRTYCACGGHPSLSLIPTLLLRGARDFGPGILELDLYLHVAHLGIPRAKCEKQFVDFHSDRNNLPRIVFYRKRGKVEIAVASELVVDDVWATERRLSLGLFSKGVEEVLKSLQLLKKRITSKDAFDLKAFMCHCQEMGAHLPTNDAELAALKDEAEKAHEAKLAAMSVAEKIALAKGLGL